MCGQKRWVELCEQATVKQDSKKLLELTREINRLLTETRNRIDNLVRNHPVRPVYYRDTATILI